MREQKGQGGGEGSGIEERGREEKEGGERRGGREGEQRRRGGVGEVVMFCKGGFLRGKCWSEDVD